LGAGNSGCLGFDAHSAILSGCGDHWTVRVWELATERERWSVGGDNGQPTSCIASSPDGSIVATGACDTKSIVIREAKAGKVLRILGKVRLGVDETRLVFSPNSLLLGMGDDDGIRLWNPVSGELVQFLSAPNNGTKLIGFSADQKFLITGHVGVGVRRWDLAKGVVRWSQDATDGVVAYAPGSPLVAAKSAAGGINFWNADTGLLEQTWDDVPRFDSLAISSGGALVAFKNGLEPIIHLWPVERTIVGRTFAQTLPADSGAQAPQATEKTIAGRVGTSTISGPAISDSGEAVTKSAVPTEADQKKSLATLDEIYQFAHVTTPVAQVKLATEFLALAENSKGKPDEQFAVLRKAAELACDAGDADIMLQAVDAIAAAFEVDGTAIKGKLLTRLAEGATDAARIERFIKAAERVIKEDLDEDRYEAAEAVSTLAGRIAQKQLDSSFRREVHNVHLHVQRLRKEWQPVLDALQTLKSQPDDSKANLAVGRWYCLNKGDWEKGLPYLAKGGDSKLCQTAREDLRSPQGAESQLKLADAWWDLAANKAGELEPDALRLRAGYWYKQLPSEANIGLLRMKIEKRLNQIERSGRPVLRDAGKAKAIMGTIDLMALVDRANLAKHVAAGQWEVQRSGLAITQPTMCGMFKFPVIPAGSFEYETEFTRISGDSAISLQFPVGHSYVNVEVSGFHGRYSGMGLINGVHTDSSSNPTSRPNSIPNNVRNKLAVRVRFPSDSRTEISAAFNGKELFHWRGDVSALSGSGFWQMGSPATVALGADSSVAVFHTASLRMLNGYATGLDGQPLGAGVKTERKRHQ
jgi:hypothetical protein